MDDYIYFKYKPVDKHLLDALVRSYLYFSSRSALNDPFDSNVDVRRAIRHLLNTMGEDKHEALSNLFSKNDFFTTFQMDVNKLGICSFSLNNNETLMWSHYSRDHKGLCLRYEFPRDYLNNEEEIFGVSKVFYDKNRVSDWIFNNIDLHKSNHYLFVTELLKVLLTAKAPAWCYEEEVRIIRDVIGPFEIPRKYLTHIIFGLQTSVSDRKLIRSIASNYYDGIRFGNVVRTNDDFGIDIEEI